jgi:hypothetical protein
LTVTDWKETGAADARAEGGAIGSVEARRRANVRDERGLSDSAAYWTGYAEEAERMAAEEPRPVVEVLGELEERLTAPESRE